MGEKMNPYEIIQYPLMTEKVMKEIENENKVSFVVSRRSTKKTIKCAVTELYGIEIKKINTLISTKGNKVAIILLKEEKAAESLATKLGML